MNNIIKKIEKKINVMNNTILDIKKKINNYDDILKHIKKKILIVIFVINNNYKTIFNLYKQKYKNFLILLIDFTNNKSLKKYTNKYKNIIYTTKNKNISINLNYGLHLFKKNNFDYITFLHSNNYYYPNFIKTLLNSNEVNSDNSDNNIEKEITFYYSNNLFIDKNNKEYNKKYENINELLDNNVGVGPCMWSKNGINQLSKFQDSLNNLSYIDFIIRSFQYLNKKYISDITIIANSNNSGVVSKYCELYKFLLKHKEHNIIIKNNNLLKVGDDFIEYNLKIDIKKYLLDNNFIIDNDSSGLITEGINLIKNSVNKKCEIFNNKIVLNNIDVLNNEDNSNKIIRKDEYKISIVMAYYNRKKQLMETLNGFEKMYGNKYDFELIIVDDNSNEENRLEDIVNNYSFYIHLIRISKEEKGERINPCIAYNKGFEEAKGEIIIIQNPECFHVGNILEHIQNNLKEEDYFSYSCFNANSYKLTQELLNSKDIINKVNYEPFLKRNVEDPGTQMNWLNHPTDEAHGGRQNAYHFCSVIYKSKLDLIGGFDKRFGDGYCFDDDEFILSIKYNLQLKIKIVKPDECFVIHQYHTKNASFCINSKSDDDPIKKKWLGNKALYEDMKNYHEEKNFNYPKLLFLYWDESPMSFLNYLTVVSFNDHHKNWKIIVFTPEKRTKIISWKTHEQKLRYTGKCYFHKLYEIENVIIKKINLDKIGFKSDASEVIKSDYFRYYILEKHGGLWSDFDIMYTASVEDKMNFKEDTVIFECFSYSNPKNKDITKGYKYYPIGLFLTKPKVYFFKYLLNYCNKNYDSNEYQSIGAVMFNKIFIEDKILITDIQKSIKICDNKYYLPWAWNELYEFLYEKNNKLPNCNIGIHWFNGADKSKKYTINLNKRLKDFKIINYIDKYINLYLNKKKISIVMAYFNRKKQLIQTLNSIMKSNYKNIEIIIVDDNSRDDQRVESFINKFKNNINIKVITITENKKTWVNPCIPYNMGIEESTGDIIIIQNPEVIHIGDCLSYIVKNIEEKDWITFNCYGSPNFEYNNKILNKSQKEIYNIIYNSENKIGGNSVVRDDVGGWLNHYENHFVAYHYLAAIKKDDLVNYMNYGFEEKFKDGIGSDDDEFVKRLIYNNFNFKISEFKEDKPFCIHQFHEKPKQLKHLDWRENKKYFIESCKNMGFESQNDIAIAPKNEIPMYKRMLV